MWHQINKIANDELKKQEGRSGPVTTSFLPREDLEQLRRTPPREPESFLDKSVDSPFEHTDVTGVPNEPDKPFGKPRKSSPVTTYHRPVEQIQKDYPVQDSAVIDEFLKDKYVDMAGHIEEEKEQQKEDKAERKEIRKQKFEPEPPKED